MRHQHTRNKYTLCHKETIALNDEKSRVNRTKLRFFLKKKRKESESHSKTTVEPNHQALFVLACRFAIW